MSKRKPTIYIDYELNDYFKEYNPSDIIGYITERNSRLLTIIRTLLCEGFPKSREAFLERILLEFGISKRTAKEYMNDAEMHTFKLIEKIAQKA